MLCRGLIALAVVAFTVGVAPQQRLTYPVAPRGTDVDTYYGTRVPDPYRSLEATSAPTTRAWVAEETSLARTVLGAHARPAVAAAVRAMQTIHDASTPDHYGAVWFRADYGYGGRAPTLRVCARKDARVCRVLLDGAALAKDGHTQLDRWRVSPHGTYVAYATTVGGTDSQTYHVRRVSDGRDLPDVLTGPKYWFPTWDGEKSFYWEGYRLARDGSTVGPYRIFHHRLGTSESADTLVYEPPAGQSWYSSLSFTKDHRYAIVGMGSASGYGRLWRPAGAPVTAPFKTLFPFKDASYAIFANEGPRLYVLTTDGAPNGRIVWVDIRDPRHTMHTIVPQSNVIIDDARMVGGRVYLSLIRDVQSEIRIFTKSGVAMGVVPLPQRGTVNLEGSDDADRALEFNFSSFTEPGLSLAYDARTHLLRVRARTEVPFDRSAITVDQEFTRSEDGTRIPYFLVHRRDMRYDGSTPTILYGYGGFGVRYLSMPGFCPLCAIWVAHGGAYAVASVRGGGEYGEEWHRAAMLTHKQRSFDDFAAVARALHETGVSDRDHLGIYGVSGGGLLVAAAETEHPELYGAVVAQSGLYDMLRYQKFDNAGTWVPEDGASDRSEAEFRALAAYSPYHNIREGTAYPATLVITGDADDRVNPAHSYKFAAALQHAQASTAPILLDVIAGSGHNDAREDAVVQRMTDVMDFFGTNLGMDW